MNKCIICKQYCQQRCQQHCKYYRQCKTFVFKTFEKTTSTLAYFEVIKDGVYLVKSNCSVTSGVSTSIYNTNFELCTSFKMIDGILIQNTNIVFNISSDDMDFKINNLIIDHFNNKIRLRLFTDLSELVVGTFEVTYTEL